ncbi:MAG: helix-turn-helix transcriptional regulator [Fervidicoccaceae archaeon]
MKGLGLSSLLRSTRTTNGSIFKSRSPEDLQVEKVRGVTLMILQCLRDQGELSSRDLERILGIPARTLRVYLWRMRRHGLVSIARQYYYYYYRITEKGLKVLTQKTEFMSESMNLFSWDLVNQVNTNNTNNRINTNNRSFSSDQVNTNNRFLSDQVNTNNTINTNNRINLDPHNVNLFVNYVKNKYNLSDEEVVVVVGMVVNLLRSGCRRKYLRFSDSYQMEEFFGIRSDDLREIVRVLENKGIVYVYHDRSTIKIGLMRGFVEEIEREIGVCR